MEQRLQELKKVQLSFLLADKEFERLDLQKRALVIILKEDFHVLCDDDKYVLAKEGVDYRAEYEYPKDENRLVTWR